MKTRVTITVAFMILLALMVSAAYAEHRPYTLNQPTYSSWLNNFWSIKGFAEDTSGIAHDPTAPVILG